MASVLTVAGCEDPQQPAKPPQTAMGSSGTTDHADLAERFAPHMWLADLDAYDPMAADEFVDGAELRWAHDLTLIGDAVDTDVGKVDYAGLECGGSLTLLAVEPDTVTLTETITDDTGEVSCTANGTVTLARNGDVLDMAYATEDGEQVMTARLARQSG